MLVKENASEPKPVLGFFSLNLCQIKSETLSAEDAKKLPHDVSGIRLGRLAVAKAHQRQGVGKTLLVAAMRKFMEIFNTAGGIGLFVDAKDHEAKRYYEQFGFVSLPSNELELFLPGQDDSRGNDAAPVVGLTRRGGAQRRPPPPPGWCKAHISARQRKGSATC